MMSGIKSSEAIESICSFIEVVSSLNYKSNRNEAKIMICKDFMNELRAPKL